MITSIVDFFKPSLELVESDMWCWKCEGRGHDHRDMETFGSIFSSDFPCDECNGTGLSLLGWVFSDDPEAVPPVWPDELGWEGNDVLLIA